MRSWTLGLRSPPDHALLDDPRELAELRHVRVVSLARAPNFMRLTRSSRAARSALSPGAGRPSSFTTALCPRPETPSLCLTSPTAPRAAGPEPGKASMTSSAVRRSSTPKGYERPPGQQLPAAALGPQVEVPGIGAVHGDAERRIARSRSSSVVL